MPVIDGEPLTRSAARDLFVSASLAHPDQQLFVLAQRLRGQTGASNVRLLEKRCGRVQVRNLLKRSSVGRDATTVERKLYKLSGQTPKLIAKTTLIVSAPRIVPCDPLQRDPAPAVLELTFEQDSPFLSGLRRSSSGLRALGNLTHVLLESEHRFRFNRRVRQFHRRSVRPRRPGDVAYLALHAARDVLSFDGHSALLLWEPDDETLEVIAHLAGERPSSNSASSDEPVFGIQWSAKHASLLLGQESRHRCFLVTRDAERRGATVTEIGDIAMPTASRISLPSADVQHVVSRLIRSLTNAELVPGRSALVFPLRQGTSSLGVLVISAMAKHAFTTRDVTAASEFALACIPPLSRASRLLGDFRLSKSVLERTAALEPDIPIEENGPLTATLSLLCDRLAREIGADSVALIPYAYKRGEIVSQGIALAGLDLKLNCHRIHPGGIVERIIVSSEPVEWYRSDDDEPQDLSPFVAERGIRRVYGVPLRAPDGNPLGVVLVGWRGGDSQSQATGARRRKNDISRIDRHRTADFRRVAEAYLARHSAWFVELKGQRLLSEVYTDLLRSIGSASEDPVAVDFLAIRHDILGRLLAAALDLIGGTAGLFAEPSGEHSGLDILASVGHRPEFEGSHIPFGLGVTGRCAELKKVCVIPDTDDPETWPEDFKPRETIEGARCEVAFPVTDGSVHELLLGVFDLENQHVSHAYGESDWKLTQRIVQAASIAIGLTRQFEQVQSIARLGRMIDDAIRDSEEEVFRVALEEAARVTGSFAASARVADRSGTILLPVHHHGDAGSLADEPISASAGANGAAFRSETLVCIGDILDRKTYPQITGFNYLPARDETRSECAIPIHWYGHRIGVCNFEHRQPYALTPYRLYLQTVGAQISHAVRQRRERDRARLGQGIELVEVLSAFYMNVNHSIAGNFSAIRNEIAKMEARSDSALDVHTTETIERIKSTAETGMERAAALLRGATGDLDEAVVVTIRELLDTVKVKVVQLHGNSSRLSVDYGVYDCRIVARKAMLGWILHEVVENSYTHGGDDTHVWIAVEAQEAKGAVAIIIDDNGSGLSPERLKDLYDHHAREASDSHHGLGLVAAELYLRTMRGRISSSESPQGGLRTTIVLPWHRTPEDNAHLNSTIPVSSDPVWTRS